MSKHRKHRIPATPRAERPATLEGPVAIRQRKPTRNVLLQLLAILGLSTVLGFTFNSANPLGVKFNPPASPPVAIATNVPVIESPPANQVADKPVVAPVVPSAPIPALPTNLPNVAMVAPKPQPAPPATAPLPPPPSKQKPWSVSVAPHSHDHPTAPAEAAAQPTGNPSPIHWPEAKELVAAGRALLVDVRHKAMYDAGHIPGAFSLPEFTPVEEIKAFLGRQPEGRILIVYCSSTSCSQSARVAARLVTEYHYPEVRYMTGGYAEYQQAEYTNPQPTSPTP